MSSTPARDELIDALESLEGTRITADRRRDIGRLVSDYHGEFIDRHPDNDEKFHELLDRTNPIENALRAYEVRETAPTADHITVMRDLLTGECVPTDAKDALPQPALDEFESPLEGDPELQDALNKALAGLIPEFQEPVEDETKVYCGKCDTTHAFAMSTLSVHNMRRHEYHPDIYDYDGRECGKCGATTSFEGVASETGVQLKACTECGTLQ